ncbi:MerR family transcriptional regulator [Streptomyces sp. NPDC058374]|uniref:MerR family transcriptional regulator n=1 Tax=Streptomyces sp. NPDC058374 TaxID=3346466 RepID=UPI00365BA018
MRISQLAARSGVPATTLRFYEGAGLLPAERTPAGYRMYGESAVQRLAFIGAAKHLGLPLEEISELLTVWETAACRDVRADLRPRVAERIADAEHRTAELAAFTASLHRALEHLDALPDRAGRCDPGCHFLARSPSTGVVRSAGVPLTLSGHSAGQDPQSMVSVACSLTGESRRERTAAWRDALDGATRSRVPGGVRLTLPSARAGTVAALAAAEQECCPALDFRLHFDGPVLHLEVSAPDEDADLLAELFTTAV